MDKTYNKLERTNVMKRNYNTKQRQTVVDFVKKTKGTHFSVDDIYVRIKEAGLSMGKATVYRHINDLTTRIPAKFSCTTLFNSS